MRAPAVKSSFDVAYWFLDTALDDIEYLQPGKMQSLLYLSQAYYAVAYNKRMLMPSIFLATDTGVIEPQVYRIFEGERPALETKKFSEDVLHFLTNIWRKFGSYSGEYLAKNVSSHDPFVKAMRNGVFSPISFEDMYVYYSKPTRPKKDGKIHGVKAAPDVDKIVRPKIMRSQSGKVVSVKQWSPKSVKK